MGCCGVPSPFFFPYTTIVDAAKLQQGGAIITYYYYYYHYYHYHYYHIFHTH
jgi:hypothetical protein